MGVREVGWRGCQAWISEMRHALPPTEMFHLKSAVALSSGARGANMSAPTAATHPSITTGLRGCSDRGSALADLPQQPTQLEADTPKCIYRYVCVCVCVCVVFCSGERVRTSY